MIKYKKLTHKIIKAFYDVYNELGTGFLESVYENALYQILVEDFGLNVEKQLPVEAYFRDKIVGFYRADLVVEKKVVIELKAVSNLLEEHEAQIINYLKATELEVGLLMNFGDKPEFRRFIFNKKS